MLVNILIHSPALSVSLQLRDTEQRVLQPRAVYYIVQPSSLTQSLMFVCLSLFHLIPIKMLF